MNYREPSDNNINHPHFNEWPNHGGNHDDWPHYRNFHIRNDSEYACVGDFKHECCNDDYPEDCVCVTSADAERWNSLSSVSALTAIDLSALSALSGINSDSLSAVISAYETNDEIWSSAAYIPNIYDNINNLISAINDKVNITEFENYKNKGINVDSKYFAGNGTENSVLRLSTDVRNAIAYVLNTTSAGYPLVNAETTENLKTDINTLNTSAISLLAKIDTLWELFELGGGDVKPPEAGDFQQTDETSLRKIIELSKNNKKVFYYTTGQKIEP